MKADCGRRPGSTPPQHTARPVDLRRQAHSARPRDLCRPHLFAIDDGSERLHVAADAWTRPYRRRMAALPLSARALRIWRRRRARVQRQTAEAGLADNTPCATRAGYQADIARVQAPAGFGRAMRYA